MRALAALFGVLAPLATITGVVFGIYWKVKHPLPVSERGSRLSRIVKSTILIGLALLLVIAMVAFGVGMVRTAFEINA